MRAFTVFALLLLFLSACWAQTAPAQPTSEVYGISALYLYPICQSVADFEKATGQKGSAFEPSFRPKYWFDPKADVGDPEADVCYRIAKIVNTSPMVVQVCMPAFEAARVNIPSGAAEAAEKPRVRPEREVPIRALLHNEALVNTPFGIQVVNLEKRAERVKTEGAFLPADRSLLEAIAEKLGVKR
jgi:hypothetical protein